MSNIIKGVTINNQEERNFTIKELLAYDGNIKVAFNISELKKNINISQIDIIGDNKYINNALNCSVKIVGGFTILLSVSKDTSKE